MKGKKDILENLKEQGRTVTWLSKRLEISRGTFYSRCKDDTWTKQELMILNLIGIL